MQIRGVLFDFGNTLVSLELNWNEVIPQNIASLENYLNSQEILVQSQSFGYSFLERKKQYNEKSQQNLIEYCATDILNEILVEAGYISPMDIIEKAIDRYFSPEEALYPVIDGAYKMLDELKSAGYKLAVVSNATSGSLIRKALQNRNYTHYFDSVIISADIGIRKPAPKIFQKALAELNLAPSQAVMVGDILSYDIAGAQRIGLKTILVKYIDSSENNKIISDDSIQPDAIAYKITDIPCIIRDWN